MKNGRIAVLLICVLALTALVGAASAEVIEIGEAGLRLTVEERYFQLGLNYISGYYDENNHVYVTLSCMDPGVFDEVNAEFNAALNSGDDAGAEAALSRYYAHLNEIVTLVMMEETVYAEKAASGEAMPFDVSAARELGAHNGYLYWALEADADAADKAEVQSEAEIAAWQECAAMLSDLDAVIGFIPVEKRVQIAEGVQFPAFATQDLTGAEVTEDIFAAKDLTVVNFWGTFCGPCIGEMPELGEWARELPDNVQIIGLLVDVEIGDTKGIEKAVKIHDKAKADYPSLLLDESLSAYCAGAIAAVPTTILVNSEGVVVGDPIVGAAVDRYKAAVEAFFDGK